MKQHLSRLMWVLPKSAIQNLLSHDYIEFSLHPYDVSNHEINSVTITMAEAVPSHSKMTTEIVQPDGSERKFKTLFFPQNPKEEDSNTNPLKSLIEILISAESEIVICMYRFNSERLIETIKATKLRGVKVSIIIDDNMANNPTKSLVDIGCNICTKNDAGSMHHKFIIIDDKLLLTGSLNFTDDALINQNNNVIVIEDKETIHDYRIEFNTLWTQFGGHPPMGPTKTGGKNHVELAVDNINNDCIAMIRAIYSRKIGNHGRVCYPLFFPLQNGNFDSLAHLKRLIRSAKYIDVCMFFMHQVDLIQEVCFLPTGMGPNIRFINCECGFEGYDKRQKVLHVTYWNRSGHVFDTCGVYRKESIEFQQRLNNYHFLREVITHDKHGHSTIKPCDKRNHMHHKFMVIDRKIVVTGSFNWTDDATNIHNENVVIVHDHDVAREYTTEFVKLWNEQEPNVRYHANVEAPDTIDQDRDLQNVIKLTELRRKAIFDPRPDY